MDLLNKVMLVGNLTRDPEIRETASGKAVAELTLAIDPPGAGKGKGSHDRDRDHAHVQNDDTIFVEVVLWERTAENAADYLKKGSPVLIEGRLRMDSWEDKETGKIRRKLKVAGERMKFLNLGAPRGDRERDREESRGSYSTQRDPAGAQR
jgi:single-strand DNA-binding protein